MEHHYSQDDTDILSQIRTIQSELNIENENLNPRIENHFEFIKEEVEIRIESLREQLNEAEKVFVKKMHESKEKMKEKALNSLQLEDCVEKSVGLELQNELQEKLKSLKDSLEKIKNSRFEVNFLANEFFQITFNSIGSVVYNPGSSSLNVIKMKNKINFNYEKVKTCLLPRQILKLNNYTYVIDPDHFAYVNITDPNFKTIKRFNIEDGYKLKSLTHDENYVYGASTFGYFKFDHDFNSIGHREFVECSCYYDHINCLYAKNNKLFACVKNTIEILWTDTFRRFRLVSDLNCEEVYKIRIIKNVACVSCRVSGSDFKTRFYKLPEFELITEYDIYNPCMTTYKDVFYTFSNHSLACFDSNGILVRIHKMDLGHVLDMTTINDSLFLSIRKKSGFVKISLND